MPKFVVTKCIDAYVHVQAVIEAASTDLAIEVAQDQDDLLDWHWNTTSTYDNVEWHNIAPEKVADDFDLADDKMKTLLVTVAEHNAILAGLRCLQVQLIGDGGLPTLINDILTNSGEALDAEAIDDLCDRINE